VADTKSNIDAERHNKDRLDYRLPGKKALKISVFQMIPIAPLPCTPDSLEGRAPFDFRSA
jgi:hypothetical protein